MSDLQARFDVIHAQNADELAAMEDATLANVAGFATHGWAPAELMDRLPGLKLVSSFGVGYDGVCG